MLAALEMKDIILLVCALFSMISLVLAIFSIISYKKLYREYDYFMRGRDAQSLEDLIIGEKDAIEDLVEEDEANKAQINALARLVRSSIQKSGMVHYDAFEGMGGRMSFALALLDQKNTGFVLNCMHAREGCFMYIKEVTEGATDTPLGKEEKEALERALGYIKD